MNSHSQRAIATVAISASANPSIALGDLKDAGGNHYSAKLIRRSIRYIETAGKALDANIHAAACAILDRSEMEGVYDHSLAAPLLNAMPKSARRKALIAWFSAFSNLSIKLDAHGVASVAGAHKPGSKLHKVVDHAAAFAKPFWSVEEKSVDPQSFNDDAFAKALTALIKKGWGENAKLSVDAVAALSSIEKIAATLPKKVVAAA